MDDTAASQRIVVCVWNVCCHIITTNIVRRHWIQRRLLRIARTNFYRTLTRAFCLCTQIGVWCVFFSRCSLVKQKYVIYSIGFRWKCLRNKKCVCVCISFYYYVHVLNFNSNPIHTVLSIISPDEYDFSFSVFSFVSLNTSNEEKNERVDDLLLNYICVCMFMHGFEFLLTGQLKLLTNIDFLSVVLLSSSTRRSLFSHSPSLARSVSSIRCGTTKLQTNVYIVKSKDKKIK